VVGFGGKVNSKGVVDSVCLPRVTAKGLIDSGLGQVGMRQEVLWGLRHRMEMLSAPSLTRAMERERKYVVQCIMCSASYSESTRQVGSS
jgi:hypothetical protein